MLSVEGRASLVGMHRKTSTGVQGYEFWIADMGSSDSRYPVDTFLRLGVRARVISCCAPDRNADARVFPVSAWARHKSTVCKEAAACYALHLLRLHLLP
jgi:hypothetical protein